MDPKVVELLKLLVPPRGGFFSGLRGRWGRERGRKARAWGRGDGGEGRRSRLQEPLHPRVPRPQEEGKLRHPLCSALFRFGIKLERNVPRFLFDSGVGWIFDCVFGDFLCLKVHSVAWNCTGTKLASGSVDHTARVWNIDPQGHVIFLLSVSYPFFSSR